MKCRYEKRLICILVLIFAVFVCGEKQLLKYKKDNFFVKPCLWNKNRLLKNTLSIYDAFPSEYYENAKNHRIVKKQMDYDLIDMTSIGLKTENSKIMRNKSKKFAMQPSGKKLKKSTKESQITFKRKGENIKLSSLENQCPCQKKEEQNEKRLNKMMCKIPDRSDRHYYFECEIQTDGSMKIARKKCPEDETFSIRYKECIHLSPHKGYIREKKQISSLSKSKCPEPPPEGDSEPANEWLDAPQGSSQKIPSEFQPKPKLRLRIYHLRCKKETKKLHKNKKNRQKRNTLIRVNDEDSLNLSKEKNMEHFYQNHVHRHHPRSYVIRVNKKKKNKDESFNDDDEADDEDDEDDDEDEEYENEDGDENGPKNEKEEKPNCKEGLKDLFKSAKDAVVDKIKNFDSNSQPQTQYQADVKQYFGKIHYKLPNKKSESTTGNEQDLPNKVLIDANIKVDEEVSQALKNILGKGSRENFKTIS